MPAVEASPCLAKIPPIYVKSLTIDTSSHQWVWGNELSKFQTRKLAVLNIILKCVPD